MVVDYLVIDYLATLLLGVSAAKATLNKTFTLKPKPCIYWEL